MKKIQSLLALFYDPPNVPNLLLGNQKSKLNATSINLHKNRKEVKIVLEYKLDTTEENIANMSYAKQERIPWKESNLALSKFDQ
jgi:hypothetical protein